MGPPIARLNQKQPQRGSFLPKTASSSRPKAAAPPAIQPSPDDGDSTTLDATSGRDHYYYPPNNPRVPDVGSLPEGVPDPEFAPEGGFQETTASQNANPKACGPCKHSKKKCEGGYPCKLCLKKSEECVPAGQEDRRRPPTWQQVSTLEDSNKALTEQVESLKNHLSEARLCIGLLMTSVGTTMGPDLYRHLQSFLIQSTTANPHASQAMDTNGFDSPIRSSRGSSLMVDKSGQILSSLGYSTAQSDYPGQEQRMDPPSHLYPNDHHASNLPLNNVSGLTSMIIWNYPLLHYYDLSKMAHDNAIKLVFEVRNVTLLGSGLENFLRGMYATLRVPASNPEPTSFYSYSLHNAILAYGLDPADDPLSSVIRDCYAKRAWHFASKELERPTISLMQALYLLSHYYVGVGEKRQADLYMGIGLQIAQSLGLALQPTVIHGGITPGDIHRERWYLYLTAFVHDMWRSLYSDSTSVIPVSTLPGPPMSPEDTLYRGLAASETYNLLKLAPKIKNLSSELIVCIHTHELRRSQLQVNLDMTWRDVRPELQISAPYTFKNPHVIELNLTYYWLTIRINDPLCTSRSPGSIERCGSAAMMCLALFRLWEEHYKLRSAPPEFIQIAFDTGLVFWTTAMNEYHIGRSELAKLAVTRLSETLSYLELIGARWPWARTVAKDLWHKYLSAVHVSSATTAQRAPATLLDPRLPSHSVPLRAAGIPHVADRYP